MLKTDYQILEDRIRDEKLFILLEAMAGAYGCRQLTIQNVEDSQSNAENIPSWYYSGEIYGTLSELLDLAEKDLQDGKQFRIREGRCHRCMKPNYEGENNLEKWLILGGRLFLYSRNGKINIEATNCASYNFSGVYFKLVSESIGASLQELDKIMAQYDLDKFKEFLEFDVESNEEEIQSQLKLAKNKL